MVVPVLAAMGLAALLDAPDARRRLGVGLLALAGGCAVVAASGRFAPLPGRAPAPRALALAGGGAILAVPWKGRVAGVAPWLLVVGTAGDLVIAARPIVAMRSAREPTVVPRLSRRSCAGGREGTSFHFAAWESVPLARAGARHSPQTAGVRHPVRAQLGLDLLELSWSSQASRRSWTPFQARPELAGPILARRGVAAVSGSVDEGRRTPKPRAAARSGGASRRSASVIPVPSRRARPGRHPGNRGRLAEQVHALEGRRPTPRSSCAPTPRNCRRGSPPCTVLALRRWADALEIDVDAPGPEPSLLLVNQNWDVGWERASKGDRSRSGGRISPSRASSCGRAPDRPAPVP